MKSLGLWDEDIKNGDKDVQFYTGINNLELSVASQLASA